MPCEVVSPVVAMVMVGGWGEVVMQHLAGVAEVPHAGCLEPRLLMLWTV